MESLKVLSARLMSRCAMKSANGIRKAISGMILSCNVHKKMEKAAKSVSI